MTQAGQAAAATVLVPTTPLVASAVCCPTPGSAGGTASLLIGSLYFAASFLFGILGLFFLIVCATPSIWLSVQRPAFGCRFATHRRFGHGGISF
jgi:hypothetical protein